MNPPKRAERQEKTMLDTKALDTTLAAMERKTVLEAIQKNAKSVSLADLLKMSETERGAFLAGMTLSELGGVGGNVAKRGPGRPKGSGKAKAAKAPADEEGDVDTRNKESREQYRLMVLQVVQRNPGISAQDIREKVGGSTLQVRTALNFHRTAGTITCEGNTRDRVYSPKAS